MSDRYGNRRISKMLAEWNRLREAVREGNIEGIQNAFDDCEEWIDFAFGQNKGDQAAEIERLRGDLAKTVGALEKLSTSHSFSGVAILGRRLSESLMGREMRARMEYARTTLAALTGAKP